MVDLALAPVFEWGGAHLTLLSGRIPTPPSTPNDIVFDYVVRVEGVTPFDEYLRYEGGRAYM